MTVVDGGGLKSTLPEMLRADLVHVRNVFLCMRLKTTKPRNTIRQVLGIVGTALAVLILVFWIFAFFFVGSVFGPQKVRPRTVTQPFVTVRGRHFRGRQADRVLKLFFCGLEKHVSAFFVTLHPRESSPPPPASPALFAPPPPRTLPPASVSPVLD